MPTAPLVFEARGSVDKAWISPAVPALGLLTETSTGYVQLISVPRQAPALPRSLPVLFVMVQVLFLAGPRLLYRWPKDRRLHLRSGKRVLVVGAGRAGEMLTRDILRDPQRAYVPVAFVDDKLRRQGGNVHGIPIRGRVEDIPRLADDLSIELIIMAVPSASGRDMQHMVDLCEASQKPFRTVPQLGNLMEGQVTVDQLRPVSIEDLLGREPVAPDWANIRASLAKRSILVTGAGGSIGSELCLQLLGCGPEKLILVDNSEYNLYRMDTQLLDQVAPPRFSRYLVDITNATDFEEFFNGNDRTSSFMPQHTNMYPCSKISCASRSATTSWERRRSPSQQVTGAASALC